MKKLILFLVVFGFGQSHAASMQEDQSFTYKLEMSRNDKVCRHMQKVYNKNFRQPWKTKPLDLEGKAYGENSKYAFPLLPGVEHSEYFTFLMRYSKLPTSPEFEAIKWREGRSISGGGPVQSSEDGKPRPMLVAEFDVDNDGREEQVVKYGFVENWHFTDYDSVSIFKEEKLSLISSPTMWQVIRGGDIPQPETISFLWRHVRPFILWGKTYLHLQHDVSREVSNSVIVRQRSYTIVSEYRHDQGIFNSGLNPIKDDMPGIKQICRFRMIPIK